MSLKMRLLAIATGLAAGIVLVGGIGLLICWLV